ncbi:ABC transporter substrate-binding protein [Ideonella sp. BN130291]|uniref:ABC transporter substrate-binding protein n=1 Tax=Ideonella sp. BN130291 TaxID=3112940 RepID=UPI002E263D34|nr:extracellular solute-binding protein [Ideonella sp. BN130291]
MSAGRNAFSRRAMLAAGLAGAMPLRAAAAQPQLTVAAFPRIDEIVKAAVAGPWAQRHPDVPVQVVSRSYKDHHTAMTTALSTSVGLPDVMALESRYLGNFALGAGLENLSSEPFGADRFASGFVPFAWRQAHGLHGELRALPTDIGPGTLLYRVDLLAKAGLAEADLTSSWEAYVEAGVRLKKATGAYLIGSVQSLKDILVRAVAQGEGLYFDAESRPLVTSPRFVRAFELCKRVRQHGLDARVTAWTNEWAEGFKRGQVATDLRGCWMVGQMSNWVAPNTKGLWRAAQLPGNTYAAFGGTFYTLPRRAAAQNKALAWEFLQLLTLDPALQLAAFKSEDAFPALQATYEDPFFEQPLPFLGGQRARVLWRDAARKIAVPGIHKQNAFGDEVINTELDNVIDRGKPIAQALADAQRLLEKRAHR